MFIQELEQRLKELEQEQDHQDWLLQEELSNLTTDLVQRQATQSKCHVTCTDAPVKTVKSQQVRVPKLTGETMATVKSVAKSKPSSIRSQKYVIQLILNPNLPLEWSGKNWARCGQGLHYPSMEVAQKSVQQLQKRWPMEKLKIHRAIMDNG